jgi:hypothetical protein
MAMTGRLTDRDELVRLANNWLVVQTYYVGDDTLAAPDCRLG